MEAFKHNYCLRNLWWYNSSIRKDYQTSSFRLLLCFKITSRPCPFVFLPVYLTVSTHLKWIPSSLTNPIKPQAIHCGIWWQEYELSFIIPGVISMWHQPCYILHNLFCKRISKIFCSPLQFVLSAFQCILQWLYSVSFSCVFILWYLHLCCAILHLCMSFASNIM